MLDFSHVVHDEIKEEIWEDDAESVNSKYTLVHRSIGEVVMKEEELSQNLNFSNEDSVSNYNFGEDSVWFDSTNLAPL